MKETKVEDYRIEKDSLGTRDIPGDVYYGVQSLRAAENFHITGLRMHPEIINSLAYIKKAAAIWLKTVWASSQPSARMSAIRKLPILQRRP